jgi:sugar (pentulose or hexulose) kinase
MSTKNRNHIFVFDVGSTNIRAACINTDRDIEWSATTTQFYDFGTPYLHQQVDNIFAWLLDALREAAARFAIERIIPCTHGSSAVLVGDVAEVLPMMGYEAEPPSGIAAAYAEVAPPFDEVFAPINPAGLTLGRQLLWQQETHAAAFARARHLLTYPQYWAWRLTGVAASEVTSIGAQTHLWDPIARQPSSLARRMGWDRLMPPFRNAWDVLGPLRPHIAATAGLPADTPVHCGIHDSNANLLRYLGLGDRRWTLLSTGTWLITFNPSRDLTLLDPRRDTVSNTNVFGEPVASSRFMAGRELALVAGDALSATAGEAELAAVLGSGAMALPSFTDSGGPVPGSGGKGRIVGGEPLTPPQRKALALLYVALMSSESLDAVGAERRLIVDGPFAMEPLYGRLLAALRPGSEVLLSQARDGTTLGAALLPRCATNDLPPPTGLAQAEATAVDGLLAHAGVWKRALGADAMGATA